MEGLGDSPRDAVELDADEPHAGSGPGEEIPRAATGLEHGRIPRDPEARQGMKHRPDDDGRSVEGVERRPSGTLVLLGREEPRELPAEFLPGLALVPAGQGVRKEREGDRAETPEAGEGGP